MTGLALVAGSSLRGAEVPDGDWEVLQRHGEASAYVLPHRIDHVANIRALADAGRDRVLAIGSVGALREQLGPGTMLVPDDFIALDAPALTALEGEAAHRTAGFDPGWRETVVGELAAAGVDAHDGGVYWQATGPRLETPAEIRLIAAHADVIGMTIASECAVACELGLRYAALCVVDNLANGVGGEPLAREDVIAARAANRERLERTLAELLPALARTS